MATSPAREGDGRRRRGRVEVRPVVAAAAHAEADGLRRDGDRKLPLGRKARETRNRLLQAAYVQFSQTGYRGTKVGDISARAGTSLGTFYQYFHGRADVMSSLVAGAIRATLDRPHWRLSQGREGIRRLLHQYVASYEATAAFQGVWEEATHVDEVPASVRRDLGRFLTEGVEREFRRAQRAGSLGRDVDPTTLARALTAMVDRYCYLTYVFDPPSPAVPIDASVDTLEFIWAASLGQLGSETPPSGGRSATE
ncbi:MAG: TetR/AcrR family transcriptional regulator [Actinobacteria bacterium]|jgi:AcrR family transcriptional regulator|nr:MAG: TetR/AcrR family transcriptional regulator [Actinomycetota bacterium]